MVFVLVGSTSEGFDTYLRTGTLPTPDTEGANGEQQLKKPFIRLMTKGGAEGRSSPTPGPSRPTDKGKGKETAAGNTPEQAGILGVGGAGSEDSAGSEPGVRGEVGGPGTEHSAGPEAGVGDELGGDAVDSGVRAATVVNPSTLLEQLRSTVQTLNQSGEFSCKPKFLTMTD